MRSACRVAVLVVLVAVPLAPVALFALFAYGPRWESGFERKCHQIADGMTLAEVQQVLGFDGELQTSVPGHWNHGGETIPFIRGDAVFLWARDGEQIWVGFQNGRVVSKYFHDLNYL